MGYSYKNTTDEEKNVSNSTKTENKPDSDRESETPQDIEEYSETIDRISGQLTQKTKQLHCDLKIYTKITNILQILRNRLDAAKTLSDKERKSMQDSVKADFQSLIHDHGEYINSTDSGDAQHKDALKEHISSLHNRKTNRKYNSVEERHKFLDTIPSEMMSAIINILKGSERYDDILYLLIYRYPALHRNKTKLVNDIMHRSLFNVSCKYVISDKRMTCRLLAQYEQEILKNSAKDEEKGELHNEEKIRYLNEYKQLHYQNVVEICKSIIDRLDEDYIPATTYNNTADAKKMVVDKDMVEANVFFMKMRADYYRYMAEVLKHKKEEFDSVVEEATTTYEHCYEKAKNMLPTHPIRLGVALNYSVHVFEILDDLDRAYKIASLAFDDAISRLELLGDENYKDSTLIMQLLRDNMKMWKPDDGDD